MEDNIKVLKNTDDIEMLRSVALDSIEHIKYMAKADIKTTMQVAEFMFLTGIILLGLMIFAFLFREKMVSNKKLQPTAESGG